MTSARIDFAPSLCFKGTEKFTTFPYHDLASRRRGRSDPAKSRCRREHERFDDDRNGARGLEHRADIDEIELLEHDAVDRDDGVLQLRLFLGMNADQAADIAVAD